MNLSDFTGTAPISEKADAPKRLSDFMGDEQSKGVWYNDAGQAVDAATNKPIEQVAPSSYTGSVLPFRRDASGTHTAVPGMITSLPEMIGEMIMSPIRGAVEGGKRASGVSEAGQNPLRPPSGDIMAATALAASPLRFDTATSAAQQAAGTSQFVADRATAAAKAQDVLGQKAAKTLSKTFQRGLASGGPTASDAIEKMTAARAEKQPLVLADLENPEVKSLLGTIYRQGGSARALLQNFFETRNAQQLNRVKGLIGTYLADGSVKDTAAQLIVDRAEHARPLWSEAMAGGSIAPLEHQFQTYFEGAYSVERAAADEVASAERTLTQAAARQSQAGNVYSASGANTAQQQAESALVAAKAKLAAVQTEKEAIRQRLQQAQADGSANAPGAVWSPRLQQFLDQPEVKRGIQRGYGIERRKAVGEGTPFNPSEYAITGFDSSGAPIVGKVPNMRLLAVAKEGLDAIIESPAMKNPLTGKPTKAGLSYIALRDGLVKELDRLNPAYKTARDVWSGDTASIRALQEGRHAFDANWYTPEEIRAHVSSLSDNDRQFFIMGVADKLKDRLARTVDAGDKGRIINNEDTRQRIRPLFSSDEEANRFIDSVERERVMKSTPQKLYGGSQTGERLADDKRLDAALSTGQAVFKLLTGNPIDAARALWRVRNAMAAGPNLPLNETIAKMATDPNISLRSGTGIPIVPYLPEPRLPQ